MPIIRNESDRTKLLERIRSLDLKRPYEVTVKLHRKKRSLAQNRLLWMWIRCVSDETGNDTNTIYQYFCDQYLPWNGKMVFGKEVQVSGGTSKLNTKELSDFLNSINLEMAEQGIYLPHPEDFGWDEFYLKYGG